jgi:hypothetical protein
VSIIVDAHRKAFESELSRESADEAELEALRAALTPLRFSALKKRALEAGVGKGALEDSVDDADDPKEAVVSLLVDARRKDLEAAADGRAGGGGDGPAGGLSFGTELEALRAELTPMRMSVLKKRALAAGVNEEAIEEAMDAEEPKEAVLALLLELHRKDLTAVAADTGAEAEAELEALRAELTPMKMSHLTKRALAAGVDGEILDDVHDATDPKDELVSILVEEHRKTLDAQDDGVAARAQLAALRVELAPMKISALRKRALAVGVGTEDLEEAVDADDPKAAIVVLLLGAHASSRSQGAGAKAGAQDGAAAELAVHEAELGSDSWTSAQEQKLAVAGAGASPRFGAAEWNHQRQALPGRARPHGRFALLLTHFMPDSLTFSVPLFLKRQCDRTPGPGRPHFGAGDAGARKPTPLPAYSGKHAMLSYQWDIQQQVANFLIRIL